MRQLFTFHSSIWDTLSFDTVYNTATDLKELNLLNPPYAEFDIQATLNKKVLSMVFVGVPEQLDPPVRTFTFRYTCNMENGSFIERVKIGDKFYFIDQIADMAKKGGNVDREACIREMNHVSMFLFTSLLVLLVTKNAEKVTEKIKKHGPKSRKRPREYDYITTFKIGKITETMRSEGSGSSSVRPHLRRGHIRNQRFGKGREEIKPIFIHPVFVNADEGWIANQRKEYKLVA